MSAPTRQATPQAAPKPKQPPHTFTLRIMLRHTDFFGNRHRVLEYECAAATGRVIDATTGHLSYDYVRAHKNGNRLSTVAPIDQFSDEFTRAYTRGNQFSTVAPTYQLARRALRNAIRAQLRKDGEIGR